MTDTNTDTQGTDTTGTDTDTGTDTETDTGTGADGGLSIDTMTDAQLDAIHQRIEERRANRPESIAKQLEQLQNQIAGTADKQHQAVEKRKTGRDEADELGKTIADLQATMRRIELKEAVEAAGFKNVDTVTKILADSGAADTTELVKTMAASGAFVMNTPAPSAQIGGPGSQPAPKMDPGRAALIAEVKAAQNG